MPDSEDSARAGVQWRAVFERVPIGMVLANKTHYVDVNLAACRLLGVTPEAIKGRPVDDWAAPGADSWASAHVFDSNDETYGYFEVRDRELEFRTTLIAPGFLLSILRDVTDKRRAERERASQQDMFQQVMDAIADLVFVKGPGSHLLWANKAFCEAYGMSTEQLKGIVDAPFVPPDVTAQYVKDDQSVFSTGRPVDVREESIVRHDGRVMRVHTVKSPIVDSHGRVIKLVGVCRDITEQHQLEAELRLAQKLEAMGAMASGIAHEINTPIQFIGDHAQFLKEAFQDLAPLQSAYDHLVDTVENDPAASRSAAAAVREAKDVSDAEFLFNQVRGSIEAIQDGVSRVARLAQAMKEFGHPDRGEKRTADINRAIKTTLILANSQLKYVADVESDFGELPEVACWLSELNQVFLNILVNAGHAIADVLARTDGAADGGKLVGEGGGEGGRKGKIEIVTRHHVDQIVVSISDTGGGIPAEIRDRVFEPFFTTKEVGRGTGQGLAIARRIAEKHGGSLTFDTTVGVGTTFHLRIPCALEQ